MKKNPTVKTDLEALYLQLLDFFYVREDLARSGEVARRLDEELAARPDFAESIRGDEVRSLLSELRGDLAAAIQSRQNEIRKIFELHSFTQGTPGWSYVFKKYGHVDISDRLDILASLHARSGNYQEAVRVLVESKNFCNSHKIIFDGEDMLEEYSLLLDEKAHGVIDPLISAKILDQMIIAAYKRLNISVSQILTDDQKGLQFVAEVARLLPSNTTIASKLIKSRLSNLHRRGEKRGGLPRLTNRA